MKLLVLGGTVFVGRHIVEAALAKGHQVTILHRGHSPKPEYWNVQEILSDRDGGLSAVGTEQWDAVIDCNGYVPRIVRDSANYFQNRTKCYLFISSISVYEPDENGNRKVIVRDQPVQGEVVNTETYSLLKVECENQIKDIFGGKSIIIRPCVVAGAYDPTNRFTYWADRFARYSQVLVPEPPESPMQVIDVRDLADFCMKQLENVKESSNEPKIFDAVGKRISLQNLVDSGEKLGNGKAIWLSKDQLELGDLKIGVDFPLTWEKSDWNDVRITVNPMDTASAGLSIRNLDETMKYTMDYAMSFPNKLPSKSVLSGNVGLDRNKEEEIIKSLG